MPFVSDTASEFKSRFGFQDHASDSLVHSRSSPDILKSASKENISQSLAVRSIIESNDEDGVCNGGGSSNKSFEFHEDPSFWKDHNVQVVIRVRPLSNTEISLQGYSKCIRQESCQTITWTGHPESRFTFDIVADENVSQEKLFKVAGLPMVENCMGGYNSCMFAYGQTGSGKTHTMIGDIEGGTRRHSVNCGMTPRVFECLFSRIQKEKEARRDEKLKFTCKCSFLEIYNEQILDLLDPSSNNLQLREDNKKGVHVENLKEIEVTSARDVMQQLLQGAANRKVASTNMNLASSRSHSVFTCIIESKWESQGVIHHRFARLNLVDLAGSERQKSSGAEGERLKEATNINKSLSTLGLVIMNLVNISNGKSLHVPYRDSKLTFLLQDSLGGNSKTIIIANISPSSCCSLETLSTLKFAQRAKFIKNNAIVNEDASGDVIAMRLQIQQLKKEVSHLRGLVNGGTNNQDIDALAVSFPGSPGSFKWEGLPGSFSPLTTGKRMSQKRDYEAALVGAFRREKDKGIALQALAAENEATMQLAKQREDEIQGLKMRLRFREAGIKRLEAVVSGKISAETHLLKEKEEHLKEIEALRTQVNRNQEVTRFAMENLRLKEEIRRLKSFYEEGEREMMNEQIMVLENKLLEALDWKLMHQSDPSTLLEANSHSITEVRADENLLNSNQESGSSLQSSISGENEFLRMQAIQNQAELDTLRKKLELCQEEREKLERNVNDLVAELEADRSSAMKAKQVELPSLSAETPILNFGDQMELKTMVDAIAAASQREAEAHETAIKLSKENEELRIKVKVLIEDNNKLIELYERAAEECNHRNITEVETAQDGAELVEVPNEKENEIEIKQVVENLEHQLAEMHEENDKLMGLYEKAMQEKGGLKKMLSSFDQKRIEMTGESDCIEKLEVDGGMHIQSANPPLTIETGDLVRQSGDSQENRENTTCLQEGQDLGSHKPHSHVEISMADGTEIMQESNIFSEENAVLELIVQSRASMETEPSTLFVEKLHDDLNMVRMKLERADEQLLDSARTVTVFGSLEKRIFEADKLTREIEAKENEIQLKQQQFQSLKLLCSEMQEKRALVQQKLSALKYSLSSFSSSVIYFEQREERARSRAHASNAYLEQKKQELASLQSRRDELESAQKKIQQSEVELRNNIVSLASKLEEEKRKQESDKVLFAIDNVEKIDATSKHWHLSGKATELLKSEEEKTKLQSEMKMSRERLGVMKQELEDLKRKHAKVENEIQNVQLEITRASKSVEEMEFALQMVIQEKEALLEIRENGISEIESMILEYQESTFKTDLREAETQILDEELKMESGRKEELLKERTLAAQKLIQLLLDTRCIDDSCFLSEKMEEELDSVRSAVSEAKLLLEEGSYHCNC